VRSVHLCLLRDTTDALCGRFSADGCWGIGRVWHNHCLYGPAEHLAWVDAGERGVEPMEA